MLTYLFLRLIVIFFASIVSWLPRVDVLPFGIDSALGTAMGYWYSFLAVMWPFAIVWTMFLWYLGIRATVYALRLILGSHTPATV